MSHRANLLGRGYEDSHLDGPRLRFRRALTLGLMTLFAPGSAQVVKGRKLLGWSALVVFFSALGALAYLAYRSTTDTGGTIDLLADPRTLTTIRIVMIVLAVGWLALFVDAWRLGRPRGLPWPRAITVAVLNFAIIAGVGGATAYASQLIGVSNEAIGQVLTGTVKSSPLNGRYNVLLIGSDSGAGRMGIRPDSLTVASIDSSTGRTVLISMPRNLQNVPFPADSPMSKVYPYGFNCGSECLLNAVHTTAQERTDLYPNSKDPGLDATMDAVEGVTGLKLNYYLMVNLEGFSDLINAVGGVQVDVKTRIAKFGHDDYDQTKYIEPGNRKLNGTDALWYARSRVQSDDYTRMARQKCLLSSMLDELDPQTVLTNSISLARASGNLITSNIPRTELGAFAELALKTKDERIATVSLVPPEVDVTAPDYDAIHAEIAQTIKASEGRASTSSPSSSAPTQTAPTQTAPTQTPPSTTSPTGGTQDDDERLSQRTANNSDDLAASC